MSQLTLHLYLHIWATTRDGHGGVIGEGIEDREVEIWDLEADEAEVGNHKGEDVFLCGSTDHWKNECPSQQGGGQFTGPPAGGWGPLRGGPGGRGRGPHASRYSGQQHPSPANLQAPMHPTWGPEGDVGDC